MLAELIREHDGDEYEMLYLSQDSSKHSTITGSNLSNIGTIGAYDNSIATDTTGLVRKRAEV